MMARTSLAFICMLALPLGACGQPPVLTSHRAEIVATYPHDSNAFTQGLFIMDGQLFESTGRVGESTLRQVDLQTGVVEKSVSIAQPFFGEGSVQVGNQIFMLTWQASMAFVFNAETFEQTGTFTYPGEGWGLSYDGTNLILSDGTAVLRFLDPETKELTRSITVTLNGRPVRRLNELEWVDGEIWANIWTTRQIMRIDPQTGNVTGLINLNDIIPASVIGDRDAVANGIAWNSETGQIFITGKLWPELYEIRLVE